MKILLAGLLVLVGIGLSHTFDSDQLRPLEKRVDGPYSAAINIAEDLGANPTSWLPQGSAQSFASRIEFHPPGGYRARILRVYGDFIAFAPIRTGTVEIGWGLKTTAPDGSVRITYPGYSATPYDNSFAWLQGSLSASSTRERLPFDLNVAPGGLLESDNIMLSQAFVALNTTGIAIHMEPTFVAVYQFEK